MKLRRSDRLWLHLPVLGCRLRPSRASPTNEVRVHSQSTPTRVAFATTLSGGCLCGESTGPLPSDRKGSIANGSCRTMSYESRSETRAFTRAQDHLVPGGIYSK